MTKNPYPVNCFSVGSAPAFLQINNYQIAVPPAPTSNGFTDSPFPSNSTPCQKVYLAMVSPSSNSHMWLKNQFVGLYKLFMQGQYQVIDPADLPLPVDGQMWLYKELTVCYVWNSIASRPNYNSEPQNLAYNFSEGVSSTETITTTFGVEIGATGPVGQIGLSLTANFSKEVSHSFTTTSETSFNDSLIVPANTMLQFWQLDQTFSVSEFQVACNPANGLVLPAWQSTTITSIPVTLSQSTNLLMPLTCAA